MADDKLIARMLETPGEDAHTELLAEIIRHPVLRAAFVRGSLGIDLPDPEIAELEVKTQVQNQVARGEPDLVLRSDSVHIIVENKINAPFTDNQPGEYLRELVAWMKERPGRWSWLVIQGPENRAGQLADEAGKRLGRTIPVAAFVESDGVGVRVVSCETTARVLKDARLADAVASYLRDAFVVLVNALTYKASTLVTEEIVTMVDKKLFTESLTAMFDLLRDATAELRRRGFDVKSSSTSDFSYIGSYVSVPGTTDLELWIGIYPKLALRLGLPPFLVEVAGSAFGREAFERVTAAGFVDAERWEGGWITPVKLVADLDAQAQAKRVADQVYEVYRLAAPQLTLPDAT